ncbi:MAG: hypothetical protein AAF480_16235 [Actinomycetota bacterium]
MIAALLGLLLALAVLVVVGLVAAGRSRQAMREVRVEARTFRGTDHE